MNKIPEALHNAAKPDQIEQTIAPSLERRRLRAYLLLLLLDAALLHISFAVAGLIYEGVWLYPRNMLAVQTMLPVFFTIALYNQTYSGKSLTDWLYASRQALVALLISATLLNFVAFYTKSNAQFSRVSVTLGLVLSAVALVALRRLVPIMVEKFWAGRTLNRLIIADGGPEFTHPKAKIVSAEEMELDPASQDPFMLDRLGRMLQNQDKVVVSCPRERRDHWAALLQSTGVYGEIVSEQLHVIGAIDIHRYDDQGRTTLVVSTGPLALRSRISKRLFDTILAGTALVVLSPVLLFVAARIKLEDGGPVLFVQRRMGRGNQFFNMLKFRSMKVEQNDAEGARSTGREDDRCAGICRLWARARMLWAAGRTANCSGKSTRSIGGVIA